CSSAAFCAASASSAACSSAAFCAASASSAACSSAAFCAASASSAACSSAAFCAASASSTEVSSYVVEAGSSFTTFDSVVDPFITKLSPSTMKSDSKLFQLLKSSTVTSNFAAILDKVSPFSTMYSSEMTSF